MRVRILRGQPVSRRSAGLPKIYAIGPEIPAFRVFDFVSGLRILQPWGANCRMSPVTSANVPVLRRLSAETGFDHDCRPTVRGVRIPLAPPYEFEIIDIFRLFGMKPPVITRHRLSDNNPAPTLGRVAPHLNSHRELAGNSCGKRSPSGRHFRSLRQRSREDVSDMVEICSVCPARSQRRRDLETKLSRRIAATRRRCR
jgi:hypothetical protein